MHLKSLQLNDGGTRLPPGNDGGGGDGGDGGGGGGGNYGGGFFFFGFLTFLGFLKDKETEGSYQDSRYRGLDIDISTSLNAKTIKTFVATWNVGGRPPENSLVLDDFLDLRSSSYIYVLGLREEFTWRGSKAWIKI